MSGAGISEYQDGTIRNWKHRYDLLKSYSGTALFNRNLAVEMPRRSRKAIFIIDKQGSIFPR